MRTKRWRWQCGLPKGQRCDIGDLSLEQLRQFSPLIEQDVFEVLTLEGSLNACVTTLAAPRRLRFARAIAAPAPAGLISGPAQT